MTVDDTASSSRGRHHGVVITGSATDAEFDPKDQSVGVPGSGGTLLADSGPPTSQRAAVRERDRGLGFRQALYGGI